jgi:hypothetical protein
MSLAGHTGPTDVGLQHFHVFFPLKIGLQVTVKDCRREQ